MPIAASCDTILVAVAPPNGTLTPDVLRQGDCIRRILRGSYNAYGSLDEYENDGINYGDDPELEGLFFLVEAWEYAVQAMSNITVSDVKQPPNANIDETLWQEWLKVVEFAYTVGRNLGALSISNCSCQHGSFELAQHRALLLFSNGLMDELYAEDEMYWGEDEV